MKKSLRSPFICNMIGLMLCVMCAGCKKAPEAKTTSFETMTIKMTNREIASTFTASVQGKQDVTIMSQVNATLSKVCVKEGQKVVKGQVLFELDKRSFQLNVTTAQANVAAAKAAVSTAQLNYDSNKDLFAKKIVSSYVMDNAENQLASAKATLRQAEASLQQAQLQLSYCTITAPVSGEVGTIPNRVGDQISTMDVLTIVSDNSVVTASFSINELQLLNIMDETKNMEDVLDYLPEVSLKLKNGQIYAQKGKVVSASGVLDERTGAVACKAEFPNPDRMLHSGLSSTIIMPFTYDSIYVIPQSATVRIQNQTLVYVVDKEGKAKGRVIEVTPTNDGKEYIVMKGLKDGEEIVKVGAANVTDGQIVK